MDGFPWRWKARSRRVDPTDVGAFPAFGQQAPDSAIGTVPAIAARAAPNSAEAYLELIVVGDASSV
jgi:hypothetical protein